MASQAESQLSGEEIAKHSSREDCWVIIHGKAYDVTEVRDVMHPRSSDGARPLIVVAVPT